MKKRIYWNLIGLLFLSLMLLSASFGLIFYNTTKTQEVSSIQDRASLIADLLNRGINEDYIHTDYYRDSPYNSPFADFISNDIDIARMTIVSSDGTVLLDNKTVADSMENHLDREEIAEALQNGAGEASRLSGTFGAETYYYAVRLNDGNVLRVSKTLHSIAGIFTSVLPAFVGLTLLFLMISQFIARRLTQNILRPLYHIDFEGENIAVYDELLPYVHQINEQKEEISEHLVALQSRADTIQAITQNMKEGMLLLDKEGTILTANSSVEEIFDEEDMLSKNILEVCRDLELQKKIQHCLDGQRVEMTFERDKKIYQVYLSPVTGSNAENSSLTHGTAIFFVDTTERYKAEQQRREFSANVSHELKTPLTTISGYSEMIANGMAKEADITTFAAKITDQTSRLLSIINSIIRLSEFDENSLDKTYTHFDMKNLAGSVASALEEKAQERNIVITLPTHSLNVYGNLQMIDELLYNLLENAIKYNKEDGEIKVDYKKEKEFCMLSVSDSGTGISPEYLAHIFERFYRVEKSRNKKTGGTGLGLSIAKHICEYHHGYIRAESKEGIGTTMICTLKI